MKSTMTGDRGHPSPPRHIKRGGDGNLHVAPYRVKARVQNNRLWRAIERTFPDVTTQTEAAKRLGLPQPTLNAWLNMRQLPAVERALARRIADQLKETPEYLFDRSLYGTPPRPVVLEMDARQLADVGLLQLPPAPDEALETTERRAAVEHALETLPGREADVLRARFDLDEAGEEWTHHQIGEAIGLSGTRSCQIEASGLRKLRHPSRAKTLREHQEV